eukprot:1804879-Pyramimonas_sp.AAC.1
MQGHLSEVVEQLVETEAAAPVIRVHIDSSEKTKEERRRADDEESYPAGHALAGGWSVAGDPTLGT